MEALVERCCGLDVHQAVIVACLLIGDPGQEPKRIVRKFGTFLKDLYELKSWLLENRCTHVAMESTGVYWMPVYELFEDSLKVVVGNAQHMRNVPGRKTDVKDSEWIADLLRHGLIASSFVPPRPLRDLRALVRYRRKLIQNRTAERNRLQKLLETANIKLATVLSDVFGVSGRLMLKALLEGTATPEEISRLARGRLRSKMSLCKQALEGSFTEEHRFLLGIQLRRLDDIEASIQTLDLRIQEKIAPWRKEQERLAQIPGVDAIIAASIIAEIGVDMKVFHGAGHLAAWAGVCPGNNESAGKSRRARTRKGNVHLRTMLIDAARAASRTKGTYLGAKYRRLKTRMDGNRAAMAIAHKVLVSAYHMLATGADYKELGDDYFDRRAPQSVKDRLVRRLERLGYQVHLELASVGDPSAILAEARASQALRAPTAEHRDDAVLDEAQYMDEAHRCFDPPGPVDEHGAGVPLDEATGSPPVSPESLDSNPCEPSVRPQLATQTSERTQRLPILQPESPASLFARSDFERHTERDTLVCPAGSELRVVGTFPVAAPRYKLYRGNSTCSSCSLKHRCTTGKVRSVQDSLTSSRKGRPPGKARTEKAQRGVPSEVAEERGQ